jgi:hypothetical protein
LSGVSGPPFITVVHPANSKASATNIINAVFFTLLSLHNVKISTYCTYYGFSYK